MTTLQALQSWCYTVCAGTLFCGIVMLLSPSERFRPMLQMILGLFLLICLISWGKADGLHISWDSTAAEQKREESAAQTTDYFLARVLELSEGAITEKCEDYLLEYGIKPDEFQIYIIADRENDTDELSVELHLPQRVKEYSHIISKALSYEFGLDVRVQFDGTEEKAQQ